MRTFLLAGALVLPFFAAAPLHAQETESAPSDVPANGLPEPVNAREFDRSRPVVGFAFGVVENRMKLAQVIPNSAAAEAGLEAGMVILRINGVRTDGFEMEEIGKILGAIDGTLTFDVEGRGSYSLVKAPIPAPHAQ